MGTDLFDENAWVRRIERIERWQQEFGPAIAKSFGTTVADIQANVDAIEELVEAVVLPKSARATASGGTVGGWSGGMSTRLTATLTRPSWATTAVVIATAAYANVATDPSAGFMRVAIGSSNGATIITSALPSSGGGLLYLACVNSHVATLTGLSGDVDVTLDFDASAVNTDGGSVEPYEGAQVNAVAIFMQ